MNSSNIEFAFHPLDAAEVAQVFVVGTGRCGSTLLSEMLRLHPQVCSLSELFSFVTDIGLQIEATFPEGLVDGPAVWAILGAQQPRLNMMLRHDIAMSEVLYDAANPAMRFSAQSGVPAICQTCLPHLSDTPDALYDELQTLVTSLPPAPIGVQYQRIFAWLAQRQGAKIWVERSGGGLRLIERLIEHFPRARFVHIMRNGPDTALSMSRHHGFKMAFAIYQLLEVLGVDPYVSGDRRWEGDLSDEQAALLPEHFSKRGFIDFDAAPPLCGHYWSGEIRLGLPVLQTLAPGRGMHLHHEDILETPTQQVHALLRFLRADPGFAAADAAIDAAWMARAAALVRTPGSQWSSLPARLREQTEHACAPGMDAVRQGGY